MERAVQLFPRLGNTPVEVNPAEGVVGRPGGTSSSYRESVERGQEAPSRAPRGQRVPHRPGRGGWRARPADSGSPQTARGSQAWARLPTPGWGSVPEAGRRSGGESPIRWQSDGRLSPGAEKRNTHSPSTRKTVLSPARAQQLDSLCRDPWRLRADQSPGQFRIHHPLCLPRLRHRFSRERASAPSLAHSTEMLSAAPGPTFSVSSCRGPAPGRETPRGQGRRELPR